MSAEPALNFGSDSNAQSSSTHLDSRQTFRIGNQWYFTGFDEASELVNPLTAFWLPNAPNWCRGLANLNGYLVPVVDLVQATNATEQLEAPRFHLLFGTATERIAVGINSLPFTIAAPAAHAHQVLDLSNAWASVVDFSVPWRSVSDSINAAAGLFANAAPPEHLHHLHGARLAQWFARSLHPH